MSITKKTVISILKNPPAGVIRILLFVIVISILLFAIPFFIQIIMNNFYEPTLFEQNN
jgi:hypothetical protein